jgi:hypothetical protein
MNVTHTLDRYLDAVLAYTPAERLPEALRIRSHGALETYYAPFEYINEHAQVVICGITPGMHQARIALAAATEALTQGKAVSVAHRLAKETASFAGAMRTNLTAMLDDVGLAKRLGLGSTAELFGGRRDLVHYTSALRYPVFRQGQNYSGAPSMVSHAGLRWQLDDYLVEEADALRSAFWIPLGPKVADGLDYLIRRGVLPKENVLEGLPHPSGANAERISVFLGRKPPELASNKTNAAKLLAGRERVIAKVASA